MYEGHADILKVDYFVPEKDNNITQFWNYLKINKRTFLAMDYGNSYIYLRSIVEN